MRNAMLKAWLLAVLLTPTFAVADEPIIKPEEGLPLIDWTDAVNHVGQRVIVQGKIVATGKARSITFLNFDTARSFVAIVRQKNYDKFEKTPDIFYANKIVQIRGDITTYKGKPQIEVSSPDQVKILENPEPVPEKKETAAKPRTFNGVVRLATYNVLNMFDEEDDPYHDDEGTPAKPRDQLEKLAATIRTVDADVIALQEVENRYYLERFNTAMLPGMGYEHVVLFEGNDGRGIDVAVMSRFPVGPVTSYRHVRWSDDRGLPTGFRRDLIQVRIEPPGADSFDVFVVHLKSKGGGGETEPIRIGEAKALRQVVNGLMEKDKNAKFVVCGDFNDTWDSNPIKIIRGDGSTALTAFVDDVGKDTPTFNKEPHRSMIDFIFCSPALAKHYVQKSMRVIDGSVGSSGSDHNPVVIEFNLGEQTAATQKSAVSVSAE